MKIMKFLTLLLWTAITLALTLAPQFALADIPDHKHSDACGFEEYKLHKYGKRLKKMKKRLADCRKEAESNESKSCYYEVKYRSYFANKVTKWHHRLEKCKEWYDENVK